MAKATTANVKDSVIRFGIRSNRGREGIGTLKEKYSVLNTVIEAVLFDLCYTTKLERENRRGVVPKKFNVTMWWQRLVSTLGSKLVWLDTLDHTKLTRLECLSHS